MSDESSAEVDNQDIILRMMYGNDEGLRQLLQAYGPKVKGALMKRFAGILDEEDVDAVINLAACKAKRSAASFDGKEGNLGGWFFQIAVNTAIDTIKAERPSPIPVPESHDPEDTLGLDPADLIEDGAESPTEKNHLLVDFRRIVAKLPPQQRFITQADIAVGGSADAAFLAKKLKTAKGTVYVQRSKARETIRQELMRLGHTAGPQRKNQ